MTQSSSSNPVLSYDICVDQLKGTLTFTIAPWENNELPVVFNDGLHNCQSHIRYDGSTGRLRFLGTNPYDRIFGDAGAMTEYIHGILGPVLKPYTFGWSPPSNESTVYDDTYHSNHGYTQSTPDERLLKSIQSGIVQQLAQPKKTLVAGCSFGELVRQARILGTETWGFDVIPNLTTHAFDDVRPYLREGSLDAIPYSPADGFDTMVAIDVFEHVPETILNSVCEELDRMQFETLVLLINLNDASFLGHITMRPLTWWRETFSKYFELVHVQAEFEDFPRCYGNDGDYNRQWTVWKRRQPH